MVAIELVKDRKTKEPASKETAAIREKCYKNGLIVIGAGIHHNVLRFLAPLVITDDVLDEAMAIIDNVLKDVSGH